MKFFLGLAVAVGATIVVWACAAASKCKETMYKELPDEWRFCNLGELKKRVCKTLRDNSLMIALCCDGNFYIEQVEGKEIPTGFINATGAPQSISPHFIHGESVKISAKTVNFLRRLYIIPANISLEDIYDFANEYNTSIDYLLGRTDKEMM